MKWIKKETLREQLARVTGQDAGEPRTELFLSAVPGSKARLFQTHTLSIDQHGIAYPKVLVGFHRDGGIPLVAHTFYQQ